MYFESDDPLFSDDDLENVIEHREIKCISLFYTSVTDYGIEVLSRQNTVEEVHLEGCLVTNKSLKYLSQCTRLTALTLYGSPQIDDDGLTLLRNQSLESLSIDDAPITGSFCQRGEGRWPRLLSLSLVNTQIDDSHLSVILDGRNLESLGVTGSPVTFESTSFPAMPRLITLSLGGTAISDSGVKNVVELFPFLRWLKLSHTSISDASVQEIAKLSHLDVLNVDGTSVSSKGLMEIMNHKNIYTIYAKGCEISNSCISALKFSCPNMYKIFT